MSRKFVGKLIRIMMTKSSCCDILKKKRTIRRGSGSRPKGSYLMDLRFWNYVIPDGSTTLSSCRSYCGLFWNYVIPDGSTTCFLLHCLPPLFWNYVIPDGSTTLCENCGKPLCFGTMSFQMVLLRRLVRPPRGECFGTMSFQMVLLRWQMYHNCQASFGTMSFQMVLLQQP